MCGTSHSALVSAQAVNPESDPALRKAINHAIAEACRQKAGGEAPQSIPMEFRTPALDQAANEAFGHRVEGPKVVDYGGPCGHHICNKGARDL